MKILIKNNDLALIILFLFFLKTKKNFNFFLKNLFKKFLKKKWKLKKTKILKISNEKFFSFTKFFIFPQKNPIFL